MLTVHYNSSSGYSNPDSAYSEYTPLSNIQSEAEPSASTNNSSPSIQLISMSSGTPPMYNYYNNPEYESSRVCSFPSESEFVPKPISSYEYPIVVQPNTFQNSVEELPPLNSSQPPQPLSITIGSGTIQQQTLPVCYDSMQIPKNTYGSYLSILEQPTNRIRYRYRSEKGSHGGLNGVNSSQIKKTYPTVKLENYNQSYPVYVRASLATSEDNPKQHVHKLMGRHCSEDGACTLPVTESMTTVFQNLGILFIGKKEVPEILFKRKLNDFKGRYYNETLTDKLKEKLHEQSEREAKDMNLNSVKISFEAFMLQNDTLYPICPPIYSRPIANQKSPDSGELKIIRINRYCGSVAGGDEVYLLCEKVNKKEIRVRFFEIDNEGNQKWEAFGNFNESDVHHQVAIVFRTPPYREKNIQKPAQVYLQLYRQRDGEFSEPRTFIYKPKSVNDPINDSSVETLSSKCGIKECVLSRIKMENQPPGYKRRKYSHNQQPYNQSLSSEQSKLSSSVDNKKTNTSVDYLPSESEGIGNKTRSKQTYAKSARNVSVKSEIDNDQVTTIELNQINSKYSHPSNRTGENYAQDIKSQMSGIEYLETRKPVSISLSSPQSISSPSSNSSSSPPSSSSSISLQVPNSHEQIDFDHLSTIWTPTSEPSLVSDYFYNFMPLTNASTISSLSPSSSSTSSTSTLVFNNFTQQLHPIEPLNPSVVELSPIDMPSSHPTSAPIFHQLTSPSISPLYT